MKWGMVTVHILFSPIFLQTLHGVGKIKDSSFTELSIDYVKFYPPAYISSVPYLTTFSGT